MKTDLQSTTGRSALTGVALAGIATMISGVSVFVNSYGVHAVRSPSLYTTAKNLVSFAVLAAAVFIVSARRRSRLEQPNQSARPEPSRWNPLRWLGFAYVGLVGGGIAFVLFFDGLARTTATPAAVLRDTLVIWVAVLAMPFLGERITRWNVAAIALLFGGEMVLSRGIGHLDANSGDQLVLAATLLWAVEVIVAKQLLKSVTPATLSLVRMGVGSLTLLVYLAVTGALGALASLDASQISWVLLTGVLLAGYVGTWLRALSKARAVDVTSVLVASALVTALLQAAAGTQPLRPQVLGLALIALGTALIVRGVPSRAAA